MSKAAFSFLQPEGWAPPQGYANGIAAEGRHIYVAGQIGWDEQGKLVGDDFAAQVEQALRNVVAVLAAGGAGPEHIVRITGTSPTRTPMWRRASRSERATATSSAAISRP